jgi:D-serine deaminase-like pyridoxal phosphate-dependent protein
MAQYFASAGWRNILLAFPINVRQITGLNDLAAQIHLGVLVESLPGVDALSAGLRHPVDVWIKIDTGTKRTGISWEDEQAALNVARRILCCPNLRLAGLLTHAGITYAAQSSEVAIKAHQTATARLASLRQTLHKAGCPPLLLSAGDTPGCALLNDFTPADEIRPGNFAFFDTQQLAVGACSWDQIAVALACPVVALHPDRDEVVIYGGAIHLSKDYTEQNGSRQYGLVCFPYEAGWGAPIPDAFVTRLSQEHGILRLPSSFSANLRIGDLVFILPSHSCLTAQAMGSYQTLSGRRIEMMRAV